MVFDRRKRHFFYDLSGNLQWSFNKYDVSSAWLYGKNVFVKLNGNDGNTYISNIDQKQESLYMNLFVFLMMKLQVNIWWI